MGLGGGSNAADAQAAQQAAQLAGVKKGVAGIDTAFAGFNPQFYNQRAQDYTAYALPQLNQQYRQTGQQLDYSLADKGLSNSSAGSTARGALDQNYALKKQGVVDTATQQSQQLQQQVQGQKNALIGEVQSASDPAGVASQAIGTAAGFQAPNTFAPLGQMFGDFSNVYLANQYANAVAPYMNQNPLLSRVPTTGMNSSAISNYTLN